LNCYYNYYYYSLASLIPHQISSYFDFDSGFESLTHHGSMEGSGAQWGESRGGPPGEGTAAEEEDEGSLGNLVGELSKSGRCRRRAQ
jgi:hypothetical protein